MIYYMTFTEGQKYKYFTKCETKNFSPAQIVEQLQENYNRPFIAVFSSGLIYDTFLLGRIPEGCRIYKQTPWRHKLIGGRAAGKRMYRAIKEAKRKEAYDWTKGIDLTTS